MTDSILVDSNALIALFDGDQAVAARLFRAKRVLVPAIVCGEVDAGTRGDTKRERVAHDAFERFLALPAVSVLPVTRKTGALYASVHGFCRSTGRPIPTNDIWIAASALEAGVPVLTSDRHLKSLALIRTVC